MSNRIQYKETGIPYCPKIPNNWDVKRLKFVGQSIIGIIYNPSQVTDEYNGKLVLRSSNIQDGKLSFEDNVYVNSEISDKHLTKEGDILICARNGSAHLVGKCAYIPKEYEGITFGAFMLMFRSEYGKFMYYVFNSNLFKSQTGLFKTSTINQLTSDTINNLFVALPNSVREQQKIASFLDEKTSQIETIITKKQKLIEHLKEERIAIINQAVTKGLNPNAEMKPSGIEWLGDIPKHWEIKKLKYIGNITSGAAFNSSDFIDSGFVRVLKITNIQNDYINWKDIEYLPDGYEKNYDKFRVYDGDIVFALTRPIISSGIKSARVSITDEIVLLNQRNALFRTNEMYDNSFIYYLTHSRYFYHLFKVSMDTTGQQPNISPIDISNFPIVIPDLEEQIQIAYYLKEYSEKTKFAIAKIEQEIELIKEYKTSLINEVVTGKLLLN